MNAKFAGALKILMALLECLRLKVTCLLDDQGFHIKDHIFCLMD